MARRVVILQGLDYIVWRESVLYRALSVVRYIMLLTISSLALFAITILYVLLQKRKASKKFIGFFHPYCDNGGGGERVLWIIIYGLLQTSCDSNVLSFGDSHDYDIVIYNGDKNRSKDQILNNVRQKFRITFTEAQARRIQIVYIRSRFLLEAKYYPVATMIGQSLGSICVALECIFLQPVDIYCDTIGAAFTYPVVKGILSMFGRIKVVAYVHYPIISSDMLQQVRSQRPSYNNHVRITGNTSISTIKLWYYHGIALAYGLVGRYADVVMVNSSWTRGHIQSLWFEGRKKEIAGNSSSTLQQLQLIYPPCNTTSLQSISLQPCRGSFPSLSSSAAASVQRVYETVANKRVIVSIGQFRPEKDHMLQIEIMKQLITQDNSQKYNDVMLVIIGSTRHHEDELLVEKLHHLIDTLHLTNHVTLCVNQPYQVIETFLTHSLIGLHTMWNEHFGISVVEMMVAGLITIAHASGGPKADIIQPGKTGYLASEPSEYAQSIQYALDHFEELFPLRQAARQQACERFSDEVFIQQIQNVYKNIL